MFSKIILLIIKTRKISRELKPTLFSNKRRRTGVRLFENLVFRKLNEIYL